MVRNRYLAGTVALALTALASCSDDPDLKNAPTAVGGDLFASYVAIGNSITAGYQSSGINAITQAESYAKLLADQAGTRYAFAKLFGRGCAPPIIDISTGVGFGNVPAASRPTTCDLRDPAVTTSVLNNVAVPGATTLDPTSTNTPASNILTQLVLGGKTQVQKALDADPTFVSIWIGNNDILAAAASGLLTPTAGVSPGVTSQTTFETNYNAILTALTDGAQRLQGGALIAVVDVRNAPVLFPAAALFNAQFKAGFDQYAGGTVSILPSCTPTTTSLLSFAIIPAMRAGTHPRNVGCEKNSVPGTLVGDIFILDAEEQTSVSAAVAAYNTYIQGKATELDFAFYDPNPLLLAKRQSGEIPAVPNLASFTETFGALVSLDGVHPTGAGHELIANELIAAINAKYNITIPAVP